MPRVVEPFIPLDAVERLRLEFPADVEIRELSNAIRRNFVTGFEVIGWSCLAEEVRSVQKDIVVQIIKIHETANVTPTSLIFIYFFK